MKKLTVVLKLYWFKILLFTIFAIVFTLAAVFLYFAVDNFFGLESFNRRQILAYMGFFFIIGIFTAFIQLPLFFGMKYYFLQGGGIAKILGGDSAEQVRPDIRWGDVIGMENAKRDAWEIVEFLRDQTRLKTIGGKIIKGTMFLGPPGCGKTYLAKAIAT